jgi:uncharacterized membrane protein
MHLLVGIMTTHALYSKATIAGHPIHAMIVGFPIAFYTGGVAALVAYAATGDPFWYRGSMVLLLSGVAIAALAAVFGVIDLFAGVPRESPARRTGVKHFGLNMLTTVLFAGAGAMLYTRWIGRSDIDFRVPLAIGVVALALLLVAGALGWKLVQTHHVGVAMDEEENPPHDSYADKSRRTGPGIEPPDGVVSGTIDPRYAVVRRES